MVGVRYSDEKTAARAAVSGKQRCFAALLLLRGKVASFAALEVSSATFTFDDFIELLAHG
jgi:hypothetical protein